MKAENRRPKPILLKNTNVNNQKKKKQNQTKNLWKLYINKESYLKYFAEWEKQG